MVLIDTDVLIDGLRGLPDAVTYIQSISEPTLISAISVAELYAGVREGRERTSLQAFQRRSPSWRSPRRSRPRAVCTAATMAGATALHSRMRSSRPARRSEEHTW